MAPPEVAEKVRTYLRAADRLLAGALSGFYVVGSAALGEYLPGRSDLDFIAVVGGSGDAQLRRLRVLHVVAAGEAGIKTVARGRPPWSGSPNGVFVREGELGLPVSKIQPVASHTGLHFSVGEAFDVNPVVWKVLAERGLAFRGPEAAQLGVDPEPETLRQWNLDNLATYWEPWGQRFSAVEGAGWLSSQWLRYGAAWMVAWGVLGAPRLHCTVATGEVIGKLSAGEYALQTFGDEWHPVIEMGLAYWRGSPVRADVSDVRRAATFVLNVVDAARSL